MIQRKGFLGKGLPADSLDGGYFSFTLKVEEESFLQIIRQQQVLSSICFQLFPLL